MTGVRQTLVFVGALLALGTPGNARAQESEMVGSWQSSIDCGFAPVEYATASTFTRFDLAPSGEGLITEPLRCPTLAVPGSIREIGCLLDATSTAAFDGTTFGTPADGPADTIARPDTPFPFPLVGCPLVAEIENRTQQVGEAVRDETGAIVAIRGETTAGPVTMRDPSGAICFHLPSSYTCYFEMRRTDVLPGTVVTVEPRAGARLTLAEVLTEGHAAVVPLTDLDAVLPPGFRLAGESIQLVFDVTTTSEFRGPVHLCIAYEDSDQDGFVDGTTPPVPEENVRLLHEEDGIFVDRTWRIDVDGNEVCSETDSLSRFALGDSPVAIAPPPNQRVIPWLETRTTASRARRSIGARLRVPTR